MTSLASAFFVQNGQGKPFLIPMYNGVLPKAPEVVGSLRALEAHSSSVSMGKLPIR